MPRMLGFVREGHGNLILKPSEIQLREAIKSIEPFSIFITEGSSFLSEVIGWYSILRHPIYAIRNWPRTPYSHVGMFVGGKYFDDFDTTVEAYPKGVVADRMSRHMVDDKRLTVWNNSRIDDHSMAIMADIMISSVGKRYDWAAGLSFVVPVAQDPDAFNCVELAGGALQCAGMLPRHMDIHDMTPVDLANFLESPDGKDMGWSKSLVWR